MRAQRAQRPRDPLQSLQRRGQELKQQVYPLFLGMGRGAAGLWLGESWVSESWEPA